MNEIERVASYIRSCRDANIDCTVTIDKSKTHIILNALEKQVVKKPKQNIFDEEGITCICGSDMDKDVEFRFCPWCGQRIN